LLDVGEDAGDEAGPVPLEGLFDTAYVDEV
jgi:hypothetical protein